MTTPTLQATVAIVPGQRYLGTDPSAPITTSELVVDRTVRDELGMLHVVLLDLESREISLFAEQFEAAIATGYLVAADETERAFA